MITTDEKEGKGRLLFNRIMCIAYSVCVVIMAVICYWSIRGENWILAAFSFVLGIAQIWLVWFSILNVRTLKRWLSNN
jgi:hypothetical protein